MSLFYLVVTHISCLPITYIYKTQPPNSHFCLHSSKFRTLRFYGCANNYHRVMSLSLILRLSMSLWVRVYESMRLGIYEIKANIGFYSCYCRVPMVSSSTRATQPTKKSSTPKKKKLVQMDDIPLPFEFQVLKPLHGRLPTLRFLDYIIFKMNENSQRCDLKHIPRWSKKTMGLRWSSWRNGLRT